MKKFLLTLLILLGLGTLTACQLNFDPVYGEHEHEITGEFGYNSQIHWNLCATCDEKIDKAWHSFGPWQRVSEDSLEEIRTCLCGHFETRFHTHTLTGNVLYDDNEHYEECEKCFDHVNATAHTYGEWTVGRESTEDVQGYELQVCSCGHTIYRSLPLKNHEHVWDGTYGITEEAHWKNCAKESCTLDEIDLLVPHNGGVATCEEDAICADCGYHYIEAFGHDYEVVVTAPTCTEDGYTTHTCKNDSTHTYVDSYVDALGHAYSEVTYTWTDYASVTATRVCGNDASHVETETVNTVYSVPVEPGKLTVGTGRYTATFINPAFAVQTKDVEIPATGITYTTSGTGTAVTYNEATNTYAFEVELAQWGNFQVRLNNELLSVATTNVSGLYCGHNGSDWTEKLYGEQADLTTFYTSTGGTYVVYYNVTTDTLSVGLKGFYYTHPSGSGLIEAGEDGNYAITLDFAQWNRVSFMYYDKYITIDNVIGDVVNNYDSSIFKLYIENDNYTYISSCAETTTYKFVYNPETNTLDVDLQGLYYRFVTATGFKDVKVDVASNGHYLFEKDFVQWNNISLNYNGEWVKFANVEGNITNNYNDSFNKLYIDETDYTFISSQASKTYNFDFDPETGKLVIYLEGLFYEHTSANGLAEFNNGVYKVKLDFAQWNRVSFKYNGELVKFADVTGHITTDYNDSHYKLYIDGDDYTYLSSQNNRTYIFEYNPETGKLDIALEGLYYEHTSSKGLAQLEGNVYSINLDFNQWNRVTFKYNGQYVKFSNVAGDVAENGNSAINKLYIDTNEVNDYTYLSSANGSRTYRFEYNVETGTLNVALQGLAYEHSNGYGMLEMNEHGTYTATFDFNQWNRVSFKYNGQYVTIDNTSGSVSSSYDGSYYKLYIENDNYTFISSINATTTYSFTYTPETNKLVVELQGLYYRHTTGQGFTDVKVPVGEDGKYVFEKSMATWNNIAFVYKNEVISTTNTTISGTFVNQEGATWTHMLYTTNGSNLIASYGSELNYLFSYDPENKSLSVCLADLSYETRSATYGNSTYDEVHKVHVVTFVTKANYELINIKFNGQYITLDNTTIKGLHRGTNYGADWTENLYHDDANSHQTFTSCVKDTTYKLVYSEETNTLIIGLANDPIEHTWKDATCTEAKTCTVCGETEGTALGHIWQDADCENAKTCTRCNETEGTALGHTPSAEWIVTATEHYKVCVNGCGKEYDRAEHSGDLFTSNEYSVCSICKAEYGIQLSMVTFNSNTQGYTNGQSLNESKIKVNDNFTLELNKNNGSSNPAYYTSGNAIRIYGKNSLSIVPAVGTRIARITITAEGYYISGSNCTITNGTAAKSTLGSKSVIITAVDGSLPIVLTNSQSSGNFRIKTLTIFYYEVELTEAEKIQGIIDSFENSIPSLANNDFTLPAVSGDFTIDWTSNNPAISISSEVSNNAYTAKLTKDTVAVACKLTYSIKLAGVEKATGTVDVTVNKYINNIPDALSSPDGVSVVLVGKVKSVDTAWDSGYGKNMCITLVDENNKTIYIYRLATQVGLGDKIQVSGTVGSYNGSKQIINSTAEILEEATQEPSEIECSVTEVLAYVADLAQGETSTTTYIVTGTISSIDTEYSEQYKNISFYLSDGSKEILVYRCKGDQASVLKANDKVTVTGKVQNYNGTLEFVNSNVVLVEAAPDEEPETPSETEKTSEISFADKANRTAYSTTKQVWEQNGITVTNDKASSTTNVADYANPARFYKGSKLTISHENLMTVIVITAVSKYATPIESSIKSGATVSVSGLVYTITLNTPSTEFSFELTGQVRIKLISITYQTSGSSGETPDPTPEPQKLATPTVTVSDDGWASWEAVANASGYTYKINGGAETTITTTSVQLTDGQSIVVKAVGDGTNYIDSDYSVSQKYEAPEVEEPDEGENNPTTVTVKISDYAKENGWANNKKYSTIEMDDVVTVTATGKSNTGKYYTSGTNWRIYQTESPTIVIDAGTKTIVSVKITYVVDKKGVLTLNSTNISSGTVVSINASKVTFGVGNTGTATNGQVRITAIEVIYKGSLNK